jgi:hypothetical protein
MIGASRFFNLFTELRIEKRLAHTALNQPGFNNALSVVRPSNLNTIVVMPVMINNTSSYLRV